VPAALSEEERTLRFWGRVDQSGGPASCWPWRGARNPSGYGVVRKRNPRRQEYAHREAYFLTHMSLPGGAHVLHRCDNPTCCNPAHLRIGTAGDNMCEKVARGRASRGENHGSSKLSEQQVEEIRCRYAAGDVTQKELAQEFCVGQMTICRAVLRRSWTATAVVMSEILTPC
jgi:hypothetical protein